jgi:membrane associated rhomboid family serine protease
VKELYSLSNLYNIFAFTPAKFKITTVFTYMFLHGSFTHLTSNLWFLWLFGNNVENGLGHKKFLAFFILSGIGGAIGQYIINPNSEVPMVGASGAIAGILGAYYIMSPNAQIHIVIFFIFITKVKMSAKYVIGFWFITQLSNGFTNLQFINNNIAWFAHIGGFIVGITSFKILKKIRIE